jgi:hypothetical protein
MKRKSILLLLLIALLLGCGKNKRAVSEDRSRAIEYNGLLCRIIEIKQCKYPKEDPVFEKKKDKKLLLFQLQILQQDKVNKQLQIPQRALLTDTRGNSYENSPAVIAMAQMNECIKGDDIKAYNAIWNGELNKNETQTAYILGFELQEDAIPEKLYWNYNWKAKNIYFFLNDTNYAINH